jgi:TolB-like protein/Tfp pilus assembly protein PilF
VNPKNFFAELKRRNVYKVAVAYLVAAWLIIQIATQVFPFFEIPNWAVRLVVLLLILGFPIVLVLSWAFEITPEGIKRESEITPNESITDHTGRKIVGITFLLAIAAAAMLAFQLFHNRSPAKQQASTISTLEPPAAIPAKSIAVLPFDNLSDDKSNAYFAEGIQDEILTRLSKIAALKVISRTSTQRYKSAPDSLRDIGKQLGVANVLEGSVQKISNAVHVNVQLIRAATDEHIWAESYNRKLDDVFAVEGEVASTIAEQLNARLTGAEQKAIADKPTQNVDAYNAYLRGLSIEHNEYDYAAYQRAAEAYAQAVQLDPKFALAWARLAVIRSFLYFNSVERSVNSPAAVQEAADRAMTLSPEAGESWIARGAYLYRISRDFTGAVRAYQEAQKRLPNNSFLLQNLAFVQRRLGHWEEAGAEFQKALQLDPRDVSLLCSIGGEFYNYLRRFDAAKATLNRALEIAPDSEEAHAYKAGVFQNEGRLAEAAQELERVPEDSTDVYIVGARVTQAMYERHFDRAISVIQRKISSVPPGQALESYTELDVVQLGFCQEWTGRHAEAEQSFARAIHGIKPTPDTIVAPEANGLPFTLALAYAGLGQKQKALEQAQQAVNNYATDAVERPSAVAMLAQIQALFGDHDAAIAALPQLLQVPGGLNVADLKFNPFWDPLRKDPRFEKLISAPRPQQ